MNENRITLTSEEELLIYVFSYKQF